MKKGDYFTMTTPDVEEKLSELKNELALSVDDEEREERLESEIHEVEEILEERKVFEEEEQIERCSY